MDSEKLIYIFRHGESLEDTDRTVYERMSDEEIPLSSKGVLQALDLGSQMSGEIKSNNIQLYLSPSKRILQTAEFFTSRLAIDTKIDFKILNILRKKD